MTTTLIHPWLLGMILAGVAAGIATASCRRNAAFRKAYALQSIAIAGVTALWGVVLGKEHLFVVALLVVVVKAWGVTRILRWAAEHVGTEREIAVYIDVHSSTLIHVFLACIGLCAPLWLGTFGLDPVNRDVGLLAGAALAMGLLGLFNIINRKKAGSQVVGFAILENGLFLGALALTGGMPMVVELALFLELLVCTALMAALIPRLYTAFNTVDTSSMTTLKD